MFIPSANTACINAPFTAHSLLGMIDMPHSSMARLLDFVRERTVTLPIARRVLDWAAVGSRLGVSTAVITNWKARGISLSGALDAQKVFGCNAWWLLEGDGPRSVGGWPFARVSEARWLDCNDTDRGYVQAAMNKAFDECEAARPSIRVVINKAEDHSAPRGARSVENAVSTSRKKGAKRERDDH